MAPPKYRAFMSGSSWSSGPVGEFGTITAARTWAETFGATADRCAIYRILRGFATATHPRLVAVHMRDHNGTGTRWFKATP